MLGPGRPAKRPSIESVRELTREEVARTPKAAVPALKLIRDSHHMVARLFALGLRPWQVSQRTGYSLNRVCLLRADPAMEQLIASYRDQVNEDFRAATDEYFESAISARIKTMRMINDRLDKADETGEDLPLNQLVAIHADTADRTGYPKRKESVNLNIDFADRLEKARKRSAEAQTIEHELPAQITPPSTEQVASPRDGAGPTRPAQENSDAPLARPGSVEGQFPLLRRRLA